MLGVLCGVHGFFSTRTRVDLLGGKGGRSGVGGVCRSLKYFFVIIDDYLQVIMALSERVLNSGLNQSCYQVLGWFVKFRWRLVSLHTGGEAIAIKWVKTPSKPHGKILFL